MTEQEEIQATLAEHRAWTWNKFKEQNGSHIIREHPGSGISHVFKAPDMTILCGDTVSPEDRFTTALACWPSCPGCAAQIYNLCRTSLPEVLSVQCEVSGNSGQLVLPGSENWGL